MTVSDTPGTLFPVVPVVHGQVTVPPPLGGGGGQGGGGGGAAGGRPYASIYGKLRPMVRVWGVPMSLSNVQDTISLTCSFRYDERSSGST